MRCFSSYVCTYPPVGAFLSLFILEPELDRLSLCCGATPEGGDTNGSATLCRSLPPCLSSIRSLASIATKLSSNSDLLAAMVDCPFCSSIASSLSFKILLADTLASIVSSCSLCPWFAFIVSLDRLRSSALSTGGSSLLSSSLDSSLPLYGGVASSSSSIPSYSSRCYFSFGFSSNKSSSSSNFLSTSSSAGYTSSSSCSSPFSSFFPSS